MEKTGMKPDQCYSGPDHDEEPPEDSEDERDYDAENDYREDLRDLYEGE